MHAAPHLPLAQANLTGAFHRRNSGYRMLLNHLYKLSDGGPRGWATGLFACLFLDSVLGLLLLCLKEGAHPLESVRGQDEGSGENSLSPSDVAIASNFLVLFVICAEGPVLGLAGLLKWPVDIAEDGALDFLGLRLDNRDFLVKLGQEQVTQLISLDDVWLCI